MFMKKILVVCIVIFLLSVAIGSDNSTGITGFFLQVGSFIVTITRTILKQILTLVVKVL